MAHVVVCGLINIETTLRVEAFPLPYQPVRYAFDRVHSSVSGVGFNIAKALHTLGHEVTLLSLVGRDTTGELVRSELLAAGLSIEGVLESSEETAQSVILYDTEGRRSIHVDLKAMQEQAYPLDRAAPWLARADMAVLCNINFARPLLAQARTMGVRVATDVHVLREVNDAYNRDFMAIADILFLSDEGLSAAPEDFGSTLLQQFPVQELVIGRGAQGALLLERGKAPRFTPAAQPRPIVSTIGAGDALFSAYLHGRLIGLDPGEALRRAVYFAGYKIGESSAARGFLSAEALAERAGPGRA